MKDGFYLSTYLHIDEIAHLNDLRVRHDQNISLWQKRGDNIKLVHYWELERITGLKRHNKSFYSVQQARDIINQLLKPYHLSLDDMIEIWGTPQLHNCDDYHSVYEYTDLSYHSIAHLFSAIMMDTGIFQHENIIGLAVDGGPDRVIDKDVNKKHYYSGCYVSQGKLEMFPAYSPGFLWTFARKRYNLREGTLMALAGASNSEAYLTSDELVLIDKVDSLSNAYKYVNRLADEIDRLEEKDAGKLFNGFDPRFSKEENKISMAIKEIQKMSIRIMEKNIDQIIEGYHVDPGQTYLAMAGGYILNCPTNSYLMKKYGFKGFMAPPCVSDTGLSLGIALYAFYKKMKHFNFKLTDSYYGNYDGNLESILHKEEYKTFIKSVSGIDMKQAVEDLKEAPVVWFHGASEIGPRALGHRSILADPRSDIAKDKLNEVKQRQWWRPVAPIVAEDEVSEWFEDAYPSPFMLHTFQIKDEKLKLIPAIAHMDNSARVQTVNAEEEPLLYALIKAFGEDTGIPIICNTSLNDREEPIVDRIEEALNFALRKKIKIVYFNGQRLELQNHSLYNEVSPCKRAISFQSYRDNDEKQTLLKVYNPYNIPRDALIFYYHRPELFERYDISKAEDARKFMIYAKVAYGKMGVAAIPGV